MFLLDIASLAAVKGASQKILATLTSQPQSGVTVCQQVAGANGCVDSTRTIFGIQGSAWHVINSQQFRTPCQELRLILSRCILEAIVAFRGSPLQAERVLGKLGNLRYDLYTSTSHQGT